jgi:5-methylcytosine-specific restriction endonuclease McrA
LLIATVGWLAGTRSVPMDPQRDFPAHLRRQAFDLAGGRCEYTSVLWLRCSAVAQHADHLHPWSKGGATTLANCVASCAPHNLSKGAKILSPQQVWALERRRRRYFPPGADVRAGERYQGAGWRTATRL